MARRVSHLLDTTVLVDVLRNDAAAVQFAAGLDPVPWCSEVSRAELMRGLRSHERVAAEELMRELRWVDIDEPISRRAGELGRRYRQSHPRLGIADLIVAATAEHLGAELATSNVRHFPMFRDLVAPY